MQAHKAVTQQIHVAFPIQGKGIVNPKTKCEFENSQFLLVGGSAQGSSITGIKHCTEPYYTHEQLQSVEGSANKYNVYSEQASITAQ